MSRAKLLWRTALAVLLTGLFSPVVFAAMFWVVGAWNDPRLWNRGGLEFIFVGSIFGMLFAFPAAAILGILVEWPKSIRIVRRERGGFLLHMFISIAAGVAVIFVWDAATRVLHPHPHPHPPTFETKTDWAAWWANPGIYGGACSALFWWWLVIAPIRRTRSVEQ